MRTYLSVRGATAIGLALLLANAARATVWNPAAVWGAENYNNPLNARWAFMGSTLDSGGAVILLSDNIWTADLKRGWTKRTNQGHSWGESYWSPRIIRNFNATARTYSERVWTYESDWSTTVSVYAAPGAIIVGGNSSYITQNSAVMRWTAPSNGLYEVSLSFTGATTTSGGSASVALRLGSSDVKWSETITAYQQVKNYTGRFTLSAGQELHAVVKGRNFVAMDFSVTDEVVLPPKGTVVCVK